MLLVRSPELKVTEGEVSKTLFDLGATEFAFGFRHEVVEQDFAVEDEDDDLNF